jgi:hypothetical protein
MARSMSYVHATMSDSVYTTVVKHCFTVHVKYDYAVQEEMLDTRNATFSNYNLLF